MTPEELQALAAALADVAAKMRPGTCQATVRNVALDLEAAAESQPSLEDQIAAIIVDECATIDNEAFPDRTSAKAAAKIIALLHDYGIDPPQEPERGPKLPPACSSCGSDDTYLTSLGTVRCNACGEHHEAREWSEKVQTLASSAPEGGSETPFPASASQPLARRGARVALQGNVTDAWGDGSAMSPHRVQVRLADGTTIVVNGEYVRLIDKQT